MTNEIRVFQQPHCPYLSFCLFVLLRQPRQEGEGKSGEVHHQGEVISLRKAAVRRGAAPGRGLRGLCGMGQFVLRWLLIPSSGSTDRPDLWVVSWRTARRPTWRRVRHRSCQRSCMAMPSRSIDSSWSSGCPRHRWCRPRSDRLGRSYKAARRRIPKCRRLWGCRRI